jgi:hypothetical protein
VDAVILEIRWCNLLGKVVLHFDRECFRGHRSTGRVTFDRGFLFVKSLAYKAQVDALCCDWLCPAEGDAGAALWLFFLQEFADDLFYVAVLAVDGVVELAHIVVGDFSG